MQLVIKGIISFPNFFKPRKADENSDPKYGGTALIAKTDPQCATITAAIEQDKLNGFPSGFPPNAKCSWKDCAVEYPSDPKLHGYMELRTSSPEDNKPLVVDANHQQVLDPGAAIPGELAYFSVNTYSYNKPMTKGVTAGLNGVMLLREMGPLGRLDNKPSAEQMFASVTGGATGAAPAAPSAGGVPQPPRPPNTPPAPPAFVMTAKAAGATRESFHSNGWTDAAMIEQGYMLPPGGVTPSFA